MGSYLSRNAVRRATVTVALAACGLIGLQAAGDELASRAPVTAAAEPPAVRQPVASVTRSKAALPPPTTTVAGVDARFTRASLTRGAEGAGAQRVARPADLPAVVLAAYQAATVAVPRDCGLRVELLAAIGQVESGNLHGRELDARHRAVPPVIGPTLDGEGLARIRDTDGGALDGDTRWDHAVGPMQFLPSTWSVYAVDADDDGIRDPQDVDDAALAAAAYLCVGDRDLGTAADLRAAVLSYNHSEDYLSAVLAWMAAYEEHGLYDGDQLYLGAPMVLTMGWSETTGSGDEPAVREPAPGARDDDATDGVTGHGAHGATHEPKGGGMDGPRTGPGTDPDPGPPETTEPETSGAGADDRAGAGA